ncbi:MAG: hypothetical protein CSA96_01465 [Bacteroidetes bacterium]|nr:MAG: hypothetical protein CSA96_01465 [Bacteroidota bacterium]
MVSNVAKLTVYEKPQLDLQPVDVVACEQDSVLFFVDAGLTSMPNYQWEIWNGATWIVPPVDIYSGSNNDTLWINGVHSGINGLQIRLRLNGICAPGVISDTAVLTVDERPEIVSQPADLTICENDNASFGIDAGVSTSPLYRWQYFDGSNWQDAGGGFFSGETSDTLRLTGVPSTWTATGFRAIVSNACGPNDTSQVATLTVYERPEILLQPSDAETCEGVGTSFSIDPGVTTNPGYLWQVHNGVFWAPVTGFNYSGQGTPLLSILNPGSAMNGYAYRVTLSGSCSDPVVSDSVSLTIRENPEIVLQPVSAEICELQDTSFTVDPGVTTNPNFIWYYNDGSGSWQPVPSDAVHSGVNTNTLVLTNVPWSQNNWQYRVEVSGSCGTPVSSNPASLRVHKLPEIVSQPRDTTICELMNAAFTIDVGNTGSPLIQWEEYDGSGWQAISDGGNYIGSGTEELNIYAIDSAMTGFRYRARVQGYCSPGALSNEAVLTVHSAPQLWKQPLDATICEGDNTSFSVQATGTNLSYQWQVDMGSGFTDISDSNGGVFAGWNSPTLVLTGADRSFDISRYRVRVEGSCAPAQVSNLAVLMVRTPAEIQDQPDPLTICEFKNATFSVNASGADLSYQWQESTTGGASWTDMNDLGLTIGTQTPNMGMFSVSRSFDTNRYRVIVTGTCGVPVISDAPELRVETAPEILRQPIDTTVCELTAAGFKVEARGTNISYHWQVNDGSGFTDIPVGDPMYEGELSDSLTLLNAQLAHSGYSFRVVISGNCIPPATSNPVILLVNPNVVINVDTEADAICENGSTTFSVDASGVGLSYQWMVNRNDGNGFVALTDDANHLGSNDEQLVVSNVTLDMDGWSYYLDVLSVCNPISSASATLTVWPNPVPAITPLTTHPDYPLICGGDLLTLDGNPSGGSGNYTIHQWSGAIAPLSSISDRVVDFRTTIKGIYELAYKVTDDRGCVGTSVVTIENERPTAQFLSDAVPSCGYREVNFTNASTADAATFLWDFGDGNTSTQKDVSHGFDNTSPSGEVAYYTVKLVAASEHNCRDTARSVVTIYPKVVANIDADTTEGCHPLNLVFTTQPGAASYLWDYGDGNGAEGGYVTQHLFENYGTSVETYTVELTTTSFYGCIDTATLDVTVQPIPQPSFTAVPLVQTYPDATVTFTNGTQAGPWTYLWDFGDGSTSTEENPVHVYASDGTYSVVFYVNSGDCIDSTGTTVVIHPQPPLADFEVPESGCTPLEVRFTNLSQWATNYLWDFGDGYVSTEENPSHTFEYPGEMTVRLQATGPGGTANSSAILNVYETPNVAFNSAPDSVFVKDKPVRFFNLTAGATNYRWDFGDYYEDGEAAPYNFSSATDTLHYYYTEGYKDVKLVAWNDHCIDSLTKQVVKVIPAGDIQFPTVFRPDLSGPSGGYIDPNNPNTDPGVANSIFYPGINKQVDEYHLYVYNRWGELIFQSDDINVGWDGYIKGQLAAQGVYIWKVLLVYKNGSPESLAGDITLLWKREQ